MRRLPDSMVKVQQINAEYLAVGAHEHLGGVFWTRFAFAEIPEHLTNEEKFIGFILHTIDLRSICQGAVDGIALDDPR